MKMSNKVAEQAAAAQLLSRIRFFANPWTAGLLCPCNGQKAKQAQGLLLSTINGIQGGLEMRWRSIVRGLLVVPLNKLEKKVPLQLKVVL